MAKHVVIVGGGQAAAQAVQSLRQQGSSDNITLLSGESYPPYQRPPLSKKYLAGEIPRERLWLRPTTFYVEKGVALELGTTVAELELTRSSVRMADGRRLPYDKLLLATGSRVRRLDVPGATLRGVHYLRTVVDVDSICSELEQSSEIVIVGGGYIGLEVAAVMRQKGVGVTVLEAADRVLARAVSPEVSAFYADRHREAGVKLHCGAAVRSLDGDSRVSSVTTTDGRCFPCDLVIVGIGIVPNVDIAEAAGLRCDNGIVVNEFARTEDPRVTAAGDCTNHPLSLLGRRVRLESVPNAIHQAKVAAASMLDSESAYSEVPWFWSDQYDLKLQIVGSSSGYEETVIRGDPATRSFAVFYLADERVLAVDAINSPRDFLHAKKLVADRTRASPEALRDVSVDLGALAQGRF